jgi:hypothetical protein
MSTPEELARQTIDAQLSAVEEFLLTETES